MEHTAENVTDDGVSLFFMFRSPTSTYETGTGLTIHDLVPALSLLLSESLTIDMSSNDDEEEDENDDREVVDGPADLDWFRSCSSCWSSDDELGDEDGNRCVIIAVGGVCLFTIKSVLGCAFG
jgi:hypothetical protein